MKAAPCLCSEFVKVTEAAAIAAGRWMGQGDAKGAYEAAAQAMRQAFDRVPFQGTIVIGAGEKGEAKNLYVGEKVGSGSRLCDVAAQPLEAAESVARGQAGSIAALAVTAPGNMASMPDMYMQKLVVGPKAACRIDIEDAVSTNLKTIADALGSKVNDLTVTVLDRSRHEDLIAEVRRAGARIKLIGDGDITASIAASILGTGDDVYIGIGRAKEGVITAAGLKCLGGEIQAKPWPLSRSEVQKAKEHGIEDIEAVLTTDDLVQGDVIFAATAVTTGDLLKEVSYFGDGARSHTLSMCTKCRNVRFIDTIHLFTDDPRTIRL